LISGKSGEGDPTVPLEVDATTGVVAAGAFALAGAVAGALTGVSFAFSRASAISFSASFAPFTLSDFDVPLTGGPALDGDREAILRDWDVSRR